MYHFKVHRHIYFTTKRCGNYAAIELNPVRITGAVRKPRQGVANCQVTPADPVFPICGHWSTKLQPTSAASHPALPHGDCRSPSLALSLSVPDCLPLLPSHHGDVVAVEQDGLQLGDPPALRRALVLGHVLQHHVDEVVEPAERPYDLLIVLHDDV